MGALSGSLEETLRKPRIKQYWQGAPLWERRGWKKTMFIDHPKVKEILVHALENIDYASKREQSVCMHVVAESGGGKSWLVDEIARIVRNAYFREDVEKTVVPALRLEAPTPCTPVELCISILSRLGDPFARKRAKTDLAGLTELTARMLAACEVRVILFDNFHDIPSARRARGIEQIGIRLRDLIDMTQCLWMFFGTGKSRDVIAAESQLIKRVPYCVEIEYFTIEGSGGKRFLRLLERLDAWLPLAQSSCGELKRLSGHIYVATNGMFERITDLLDHSWHYAVAAGREQLLQEDFARAFRMIFGADRENPFHEGFVIRTLDRPTEPYEKLGKRVTGGAQSGFHPSRGRVQPGSRV